MKHLEKAKYLKMLQKLEKRGHQDEDSRWMKMWDEIRTDINPEAKWYDMDPYDPEQTTIEKADVIAILTEVAKESFNIGSSYEDIINTLLVVEYRVKIFRKGNL